MVKKILCLLLLLVGRTVCAQANDYFNTEYGKLLPGSTEQAGLWWASSGWKISPDKPLPKKTSQAITIRVAKNETEAVQLVVRPTFRLKDFTIRTSTFAFTEVFPRENIEILKVRYVNVTKPTDKSSVPGPWPDPLPPFKDPIDLKANKNQPFWIRVKVPRTVPAGSYTGHIRLSGQNFDADVTLR
ncbi:MAG: hypothetical protein ACYSWZ_08395, partial [Planctomycetota bacterium]